MKEDTNATILLNGTDPSGGFSVIITSVAIYGDIYLAKIAENGQIKFAAGNKILTVQLLCNQEKMSLFTIPL